MSKKLSVSCDMDERILKEASALAEQKEGGVEAHYQTLLAQAMPYTGWVGYAGRIPEEELAEIESIAAEIREKSTVFVVIGIGGSYLGAKAALEFIDGGQRGTREKTSPRVLFAGFNLSGSWHKALVESIRDEEISICQVSKSGGTVEPGIAYLTLRKLLVEKYGPEEADRRTYAITDGEKGVLRQEVSERGYRSLVIPGDVGGRYSVLTPVGLLPMAVAGIDIRQALEGAIYGETEEIMAQAKQLACIRRAMQDYGKTVEILGYFEPTVGFFTEWIMQLYGESEGKAGKGMLPMGVGLSRDLHSLGQFFQEGNQIFCETLLNIAHPTADIVIGEEGGEKYAGKSFNGFNRAVKEGMIRAHRAVNIPITVIEAEGTTAFDFGLLVYFFEMTCAMTGLLMGVNPFDQPGVEQYKKEMMNVLAKAPA